MALDDIFSIADLVTYARLKAIAKSLASEDDNCAYGLFEDGNEDIPLWSTTEPRDCRSACIAPHRDGIRVVSAFAKDCLAAVMMGSADGRVGRPIPPHAGDAYLKAYDDAYVGRHGLPKPTMLSVPWST